MKQLQFYKYAAFALFILNISMITFFLLTKPHPPGGSDGLQKRAGEILELDKQQNTIFLESAKKHEEKMSALISDQKVIVKAYFQTLTDPSQNINTDSLLNQIQSIEKGKITVTYEHFQEIKKILKPEQASNFEPFMDYVLKLILSKPKKNPPPPKDF